MSLLLGVSGVTGELQTQPIYESFLGTSVEKKRQIDALINKVAQYIVGRCISDETKSCIGGKIEQIRTLVEKKIHPELDRQIHQLDRENHLVTFSGNKPWKLLVKLSGFYQDLYVREAADELGISLNSKDADLAYNDYLYVEAERSLGTQATVFHILKEDDPPGGPTEFNIVGALVGMRISPKRVYHVEAFTLDRKPTISERITTVTHSSQPKGDVSSLPSDVAEQQMDDKAQPPSSVRMTVVPPGTHEKIDHVHAVCLRDGTGTTHPESVSITLVGGRTRVGTIGPDVCVIGERSTYRTHMNPPPMPQTPVCHDEKLPGSITASLIGKGAHVGSVRGATVIGVQYDPGSQAPRQHAVSQAPSHPSAVPLQVVTETVGVRLVSDDIDDILSGRRQPTTRVYNTDQMHNVRVTDIDFGVYP